MLRRFISPEVEARLAQLDVPFNRYGLDPLGISHDHLGAFFTLLGALYRQYFRVTTVGIEQVPATGRVMIVGNHAGGLPTDGAMAIASLFFDHDPPRLAHGMVEKFAQGLPFLSSWFSRIGQLTGLPEHAIAMLERERALMVFPEGARGTGKMYWEKGKLVRFGTGFLRIALQTGTPIVPFAFVGGEEALPIVYHARWPARLLKTPYFPITPYGLPVPLPVPCRLHYGAPMHFEGDGSEPDEVIDAYVEAVRERIEALWQEGSAAREGRA
ncbi:MAG: acyltransferase family protein [Myxococcales bacterium]|nr:acyltransferase family protein [Myxococcales bacterium]